MLATEVTTISITILLAVLGWIVAHVLSQKRNLKEKRREVRVTHLREAYLVLCDAADQGLSEKNISDVQHALNDIQLVADRKHYELIGRCVTDITERGSASLDELLTNLRDDIRADLDLPPMPGERWWLGISKSGNDAERDEPHR